MTGSSRRLAGLAIWACAVLACSAPPSDDEVAQEAQEALSPNPCTAVALTAPGQAFTLTAGVPVALSALATCPVGQTPEYQYWIKRLTAANWTHLGAFVPGASSWTPPSDEAWCVSAVTRAVGAPESYQARSSARCTAPRCGNGVVELGEQCDDGNLVDGDGCDTNCTLPACGNGVVDPGEACDDGNPRNGDGCDTTCTISAMAYLKASDTASQSFFGDRVALSDDGGTLAVGAYNQAGGSGAVYVFVRSGPTWVQQALLKAAIAGPNDLFGYAVALSGDGATLAIGAPGEASGGAPGDTSRPFAGAVYVYGRTGATWSAQAYVKAANPDANDGFGGAVALARDGATLAISAVHEASAATGIDGNPSDNSAPGAGAVYVFARSGAAWTQQAYVKASNAEAGDGFGYGLAVAADGSTLAVGAPMEASAARGVGGNQNDDSAFQAGATYVFTRTGVAWSQQAYIKASNSGFNDFFGYDLALTADGATLAVGAPQESSNGTSQANNSLEGAGAVYVFARAGTAWSQRAYLKASNPDAHDGFGYRVALAPGGATLVAAAPFESSAATGIGGNQADNSQTSAGAAYVFGRSGATWSQHAYVKASNAGRFDNFGSSLAVADNGTLALGALGESSAATGVGGDQSNDGASAAGAVYVLR